MKNQALYRMYRPKTFGEVIGQRHITLALTNQIKSGDLSHAYIFNGTRGVGKTSVARIFARAVNCIDSKNGEPCMKCKACLDYERGGNVDIIEIDAASNNGVQDARELADRVTYAPNYSKYKVYIIDEAHMITNNAFNALLKTIEEPPEHAIFILCTTEVQAFPATILSRCMRFDFHMVSVENLTALLEKIFDDLKITADKEALSAMALAGEGSVRDTLTVADRCVALSKERIDYQTVLDVLGATNRETLITLADAILSGDAKTLLETTVRLVHEGKSVSVLARDLCRHMRDLAVISTCGEARDVLRLPEELYAALEKSAKNADIKKLLRCVDAFSSLEYRLRSSLSPQLLFEAVALKLAVKGEEDIENLEKRIARLEKLMASKNGGGSNSGGNYNSGGIKSEKKTYEIKEESGAQGKADKNKVGQIQHQDSESADIQNKPYIDKKEGKDQAQSVKDGKKADARENFNINKAQSGGQSPLSREKASGIQSVKEEHSLNEEALSPKGEKERGAQEEPRGEEQIISRETLRGKAQEKQREGAQKEIKKERVSFTLSASKIWAEVLSVIKENATPLVKTICQGIGKVEISNNAFRVFCNPAQYKVLDDKEYGEIFFSVLSKYKLLFTPVREEASSPPAGLEAIIKSGGVNVEIK